MGAYSNVVFDNRPANDAEWQTFIQQYEAALLASGFLEVAPDTGQIDPLTVARPGSLSTYAGYRMYRAKDPKAASKPLYVKVEYGVSGSFDRPQIRKQQGTGSNGAGTLTGPLSTLVIAYQPTADGSGSAVLLGGGNDSHAWVYLGDPGSGSTVNSFWIFGRWINNQDESATDDILWDSVQNSTSQTIGATYSWTDGAAAWATVSAGFFTHFPDAFILPQNGGDINTTRLFESAVYRDGKALTFPFFSGRSSELPYTNPIDSKISVNAWGAMHTFLPIPWTAIASGNRCAFLWEE